MADLKPWERNWNGTQQQSLHQDDGKKPWERDWSGNQAQEKPKEDKGFLAGAVDEVRDFGVGAFKGVIGIGDVAVGLADTAASLTGLSDGENNVRNALANRDGLIGFDPQRANKIADEWYSDDYKKARAEMQELSDRFDNSESFGGKVSALGNMLGHATFVNPSLAINTVVESLPSMFAGGAAGRALKAAGVVKSGAAAAATGEGLVMAGQQAANIQELNGDNSLSQGQALASIGTGVVGGLIGLAGARVAQKLGIDDVDAVLANGVGRQAAAKELRHVPPMSISNMMMRGAIQEGLLEELPQSTMEQIVANLATDKHWSDGVAHAGVMGVLSGGLMGAGMNAARGVQQSEHANLSETEQRWQQDINDREAALREYHAALEEAKANFATPEEIAAIEAAFANQVDLSGGTFAQPKVTELSDYLASISPQADSQVHTSDLVDDAKNAPNELQQSANPEEQTATESQFVENEADKVQPPQKPSEQMGLDPNHGALTAIAANAVDSGISMPVVEPVPKDAGVDFSEAQQYWDNLTADGQKAAVKALGVKGGKAGRFDDVPDVVKKGLASMLAERKSAIDAAKSNHAVGESLPNIPLALDAVQGYGSNKAAKGLDRLLPDAERKVFGGLDKPLRDAMLLVADYQADHRLRSELGLPSMAHHYPQQVKDALSLVKQRTEADSNVGGLMESLASSVAGYRRNNGWQTPLASNLAQQNVPDVDKTADQQEIERVIQPLEADGVASNVVDYAERKMVLLDINGVKVPFYRSTGLGGKEDVEAGKWYPFFGIGKFDGKLGWVTKTGGKGTKNRPDLNMNDYYGSPTLKRYAQMLDRVYDADTLKQMNLKTHAVGKPVLDASGNPIRLPAPDAYSGFANQIELNSFVRTINDAMGEPLNEDDLTGIEQRIDDVVARVEGKSVGVVPEAKAESAVEPQIQTQAAQEVDAVEVATQENVPQLVEVQTAKGVKRVNQVDLDNQELSVLPTYTKDGKRSAVRIKRSDVQMQEKQEVVKAEKVEPKLEALIEREASKQAEAEKSRIGKPAGDKLVDKGKEQVNESGLGRISALAEDRENKVSQAEIDNLINVALSQKDGNRHFVNLGTVSDKTATDILQLTGQDVSGWQVSIDESAVRHTLKQHGNTEQEAKRGQVAVNHDDFKKIFEIIHDYDELSLGDEQNTVKFVKNIGEQFVLIEEMRLRRKKLSLKTMYKKKQPASTPVAPDKNQSTAETSKTFGSQAVKDNDTLKQSDTQDNSSQSFGNQMQEADVEAVVFGQREGLFDLPPVPITVIDTQGLPNDFKDMKKWVDKLLRKLQQAPIGTLHNEDMEADFVISKDDRKKMGNNRGLSHATSQAVSGLTDLVKYAVRAETHDDVKHHNTDVQAVHRLYAPAEIAGKVYRVKLTVKDYLFLDGSGKRQNLHAIEAAEIEDAPMGIVPPNQNDQTAQPTSGRVLSITDLLRGATHHVDGQPFVPEADAQKQGLSEAQKAALLQGEPVYVIEGRKTPQGFKELKQWAKGVFDAVGNQAIHPEVGKVVLNEKSVKDSMAHGMNPFKAAAFEAVPAVIERGVVMAETDHDRIHSVYISAPVRIEGVDDVVTVLVRRDMNNQRMYLHSVAVKENLLTIQDSIADTKVSEPHGKLLSGDVANILRYYLNFKLDSVNPLGFESKQASKPKKDGDVSLSMGAMASPIDALAWRVNRVYDAIAEVISPEHMQRISVITREQAKRLLPTQHHAYLHRINAWHRSSTGRVFVIAENQHSKLQTQFTAWHELGHAKVNVAGRDEWNGVLRDAYRSDAMFRKLANRIMAKRADTADKAGRNVVAASEEALVELYAAYKTGEYGVLNEKYGDLRSFVQRVFDVLRQVVAKALGKQFGRLSDDDLAQGLKNVIQDNQKLSRMMDALDKVDLADKQVNDDFSFSLDEHSHSAFARAVDDVVNGKASRRYVKMGRTPDVLKMIGLPDAKVSISELTIEKAMADYLGIPAGKHSHNHNLTPTDLKRLPEQLNNPIAVFYSLTEQNAYVVLTELQERDKKTGILKPVIAALHLKQGKNGLDIVNVASAYGRSKSQNQGMVNKAPLYWHKEKGQQFLTTERLQSPWDFTSDAVLSKNNIKTELDLKQYLIQQSFDKTAKRLGGQVAYQKAFDKGDTVLSYRQWVQVRTPEFKAWFGDWENHPDEASKIINEETGEPLVVYHGAIDAFTVFKKTDTGSFFASSPEVASSYAVRYGDFETGFLDASHAPNVAAYFLNVRNPEVLDAGGKHFSELVLPDGKVTTNESFARQAIERGADGVVIRNTRDDADPRNRSVSDVFTAKHTHAIKSAWGNTGAFDDANDDIRFSLDGVDNDTVIRWAGNKLHRVITAIRNGAKYISNEAIDLGKTPDVLVRLGVPQLPMKIVEPKKLFQVALNRSSENLNARDHDLTADVMAKVPEAMQNPLAVFDSNSESHAKVMVLEIKDNQDRPIIVAIHVNEKQGFNYVNKVASIYGRNHAKAAFQVWSKKGLLRYLDNRKSHSVLTSFGLQSPTEKSKNGLLGNSVLLATDIVNQQDVENIDDVQFSLDDTNAQGGLNRADVVNRSIGQAIRSVFQLGSVKEYLGDKWTDSLKVSLQALGRRQLMEIYGDMLPMARYGQLADRYSADGNKAAIDADKLVNAWGKLKDADALADLMHDATLAQVDADPSVNDGALSNQQKLMRNGLNKRFNALSPEAQGIYRQARDDYKRHFEQVKEAMAARMKRLGMGREVLDAMEQRFNDGLKGVYFPLARFGSYVVVAKNGDTGATLSVARAETMSEARAVRKLYLAQFPDAKVSQVMLAKEYVQSRDAVGRGFMKELFDELGKLNLSTPQFAELEDTLNQLYLNSLPDLSWAKHGIHRKGTAGFSHDARRAYAQNMFHGASYLAKLRYSDLMQAQLEHMQEYADGKRNDKEFNQPVAQRVIDEMVKRHDAMMNPNSNPLATALTSFGFLWYLGLSPASALVNMSQTPLVALPVMAAKWGATKSSKALLEASKQTVLGKNDITHALNDDEKVAFERAVNDGTIDVSQAHDLAGIAQGEDAGVLWKMRRVMRVASFMFHQAERFNRQVTFVASYRLAKAAGASFDAAFEQAKDATYRGHFDYSREARPRFMQGNVAKVVFLFKQYSQNMIYTIARNFYLAMKGDKEARKVFAGIMVAHAMAAGVLGLPMVTTLLAIASALGGDDDEPFDAQTALRNSLADVFGDKTSEVMMRGLSRLTPFDVSGRVSLDKLIFPDVQEGLDGKRWAESMASGLLGPIAGLPLSWANGANQIGNGEWAKGLESMLPVSVRNPLKAFRLANEGHIDKSGIVVKDDFDFAEITGQVVGFSPSDLRLAMEGKGAVYNADRRLTRRRSELLSAAAKASMDGDMDELKRVRREIAEFSRKNPTRRITNQHILQSVKNRKRRIAGAENGVYLPDSRQDARDAGRFAFD